VREYRTPTPTYEREDSRMSVTFNHTIIAAKDRNESARFFRELLELAEAPSWGPFTNVRVDGGVLVLLGDPPVDIHYNHDA
jgi:hypothetical protein